MTSSHAAPPDNLDAPLELDPQDWTRAQRYFLLTGLVVPRPIAWVSTVSAEGVPNVAPHSYFNVFAVDPPHLIWSSGGLKDSMRNVMATREFVVNLVTMDLIERMNFTSTDFPPDEDEFGWAGLTAAPSRCVGAPRVGEAKAHFECELAHLLTLGGSYVAVGRVIHIHVDPSVWRGGRVDARLLDPVCRLAAGRYASLGDIYELPRPSWAEVEGSTGMQAMPRLGEPER